METTEELRNKIRTADDLQSVIRTMKGMAAVGIRQYERAVESLADYSETVEMGFQVAEHIQGVIKNIKLMVPVLSASREIRQLREYLHQEP